MFNPESNSIPKAISQIISGILVLVKSRLLTKHRNSVKETSKAKLSAVSKSSTRVYC
jgi:hypothetical protein